MSDPITGEYLVLNGSQNQLTNIAASHRCDGKDDAGINRHTQPGAGLQPFTLNSKTSHGDHWSVTFEMGDKSLSAAAKCDYKEKDAPQCAVILLFDDSFSIFKAESDPCRNIVYRSSSAAAAG